MLSLGLCVALAESTDSVCSCSTWLVLVYADALIVFSHATPSHTSKFGYYLMSQKALSELAINAQTNIGGTVSVLSE